MADANRALSYTLSLHRALPCDVESRLFLRGENLANEEADLVEDLYDKEVRRGEDIEGQIDALEKTYLETRRRNLSVNSSILSPVSFSPCVGKLIRILEQKLDKLILKTNNVINDNSQIREKLELIRIERKTISILESKMSFQLEKINSGISLHIEETSANYKIKDKASDELDRLRCIADRERADFDKELGHINRVLQGDLKVQEFISKRKRRSAIVNNTESKFLLPLIEEPVVVSGDKLTGESMESIFENLKSALGSLNIVDLINQYNASELSNYSLFSRSRSLVAGLDSSIHQTRKVEEEIAEIRAQFADFDLDSNIEKEREIRNFRSQSEHILRKLGRIGDTITAIKLEMNLPREEVFFLGPIDEKIDVLLDKKFSTILSPLKPLFSPFVLPTSIAREVDDNFEPLSRLEIEKQLAKETTKKPKRGISASTTRPPSTCKKLNYFFSSFSIFFCRHEKTN